MKGNHYRCCPVLLDCYPEPLKIFCIISYIMERNHINFCKKGWLGMWVTIVTHRVAVHTMGKRKILLLLEKQVIQWGAWAQYEMHHFHYKQSFPSSMKDADAEDSGRMARHAARNVHLGREVHDWVPIGISVVPESQPCPRTMLQLVNGVHTTLALTLILDWRNSCLSTQYHQTESWASVRPLDLLQYQICLS